MRILLLAVALLAPFASLQCVTSSAPTPTAAPAPIEWRRWEKDSFEQARTHRRMVIVTITTQWCHWCHVMDEETWSDPEVRTLLADHFIAIREDADARPDLAERYADWGWPAIALLSPTGGAVAELRGYQEKTQLLARLRGLVAKLQQGAPLERSDVAQHAPVPAAADLSRIREVTAAQLELFWDPLEGGWGTPQKYPFWAPIEVSLLRGALRGDEVARARGTKTLAQARSLIDAIDGGMFQYSLQGKWTAPHYEKLADINGALLGSYALAVTAGPGELTAAHAQEAGRALHRWLTSTLRAPSGAFFANQDADVGTRGERPRVLGKAYYALDASGRTRVGAPFIDTHIYAAHNGRVIAGMARFAGTIGDDAMLMDAVRAADAVIATHALDASGARGFLHAQSDARDGLMHLGDQVAMGQAFIELFEATGDGKWRALAQATTRALVTSLWDEGAGAFRAHTRDTRTPDLAVRMPMRGNAEAARLLMKVGRLEEDQALVQTGERALRHFADDAIVREEGRIVGEYLLALEEALSEPLHFAIVAVAADKGATRPLLTAALSLHAPHRIVEVTLPGKYPDLGKPALYICGASFCSPPITDPALVAAKAAPFLKPRPS